MARRRFRLWLVAFGLLLVPFGWSAAPAPAPAPDRPGAAALEDGRKVKWEGWQFRWSVHPRNGLVVEDVSFQGRSVLKYAGLAEIFVPYNRGQPRPQDFGSGISARMVELFPGKDCVPGALSCAAWDTQGREQGKRMVMMHEESLGLSYLGNLGRAKGKMLVLWSAYNLGGYYYIGRWRFRDDGLLMPQAGLTGPLQHVGKGDPSPFGSLVGKDRTFAPSHVHNMYFCLDFDIDGADNNVVEEFNYQQDKPGSPSGQHSWTVLKKETSRPASADNFRSWRVVNPTSKNALGLPRSYELIPGGNGTYRGSSNEKFAQAELWAVRHHPKEHPNDNRSLSTILPSYLNGEDIEGQNVVLYYALHMHHLPRTEDWPGMPVEWVGFTLRPRDFLDTSPVRPK